MATYSIDDIRSLVGDDRIHRKVFTDPEIFELEIERIFGRVWNYVGHESQVPNTGDFFCTAIARQPVVMSRHGDGKVYVFHNRCAHRGTKVLNQECGNAKRFQCMYHGWTYHTDGSFAGMPVQDEEVEDGFDVTNRKLGMHPVARWQSYLGFVFASLSNDGPDLVEYMGEARRGLDEFVAAAPAGEVELVGGCHRYAYNGNWKFQLENLTDTYHVIATPASTVGSDGRQFKRRSGSTGDTPIFYDENNRPVILDIEPNVPLGDVIEVYDACRAAEFQSVNFAVETPVALEKPQRKSSPE